MLTHTIVRLADIGMKRAKKGLRTRIVKACNQLAI